MVKFLVYVVIILTIIAVTQLVRVFELASALKGGEKVEDDYESDNRMNGRFMLWFIVAFLAFCAWQVFEYKDLLLPEAASNVGKDIDWLMWFNMVVISIVFVITNIVLFYFAYKYYGRKDNRATFYPHNNKLEMIWTSVPAVVLFIIIFLGLKLWTRITEPAQADAIVIELYAKQFDWTARYAGKDNKLGYADYKLITGTNVLGMDSVDSKGWDDMVVRNEFHIPKGRDVSFHIRSRDVIHSVFMPHFRAQMNAVPGMVTFFHFVPTITTQEMRKITKNEKFDYVLMCNKICGASHYNMQMAIVVDEPAEYEKWLANQKAFFSKPVTASKEEDQKIIAEKLDK